MALDADYALPWAGLADAHISLAYYGLTKPQASLPEAKEAALRAVALDPSLPEAHVAMAIAHLFSDWDGPGAEREFLRALELNPSSVGARFGYANYYLAPAGRLKEALQQAKQMAELDPLSGHASASLAAIYDFAGRFEDALRVAQHAVELDPGNHLARFVLHDALRSLGRFEESVVVTEAALAMSGRHPFPMACLAMTYADWGKPRRSQGASRRVVGASGARVRADAVGERDEAIHHARVAYEIRDPTLCVLGKIWRGTSRLREDPRFKEILAKVALK